MSAADDSVDGECLRASAERGRPSASAGRRSRRPGYRVRAEAERRQAHGHRAVAARASSGPRPTAAHPCRTGDGERGRGRRTAATRARRWHAEPWGGGAGPAASRFVRAIAAESCQSSSEARSRPSKMGTSCQGGRAISDAASEPRDDRRRRGRIHMRQEFLRAHRQRSCDERPAQVSTATRSRSAAVMRACGRLRPATVACPARSQGHRGY